MYDLSNILDADARLRAACAAEIFDSFRPTTPEAFASALGCADDLVRWIKSGTAPTKEDSQGDNLGGAPAVAAHQTPSVEEPRRTPVPERQSASPPEHGAAADGAAGLSAASGEAGTDHRPGRHKATPAQRAEARRRVEAGERWADVAKDMNVTEAAVRLWGKAERWNVPLRKGPGKPRPAPKLTRHQCIDRLKQNGIKFKLGWDESKPGGTTWIVDGREPMGLADLQDFAGGLT